MKILASSLTTSYAASVFGFLLVMILGKHLSTELFSVFAFGIAAGGVFLPLLSLGGNQTFVRDTLHAKKSESVAAIAEKSFGMKLFMIFVVVIIALLLGLRFSKTAGDIFSVVLFSLWASSISLYPAPWFDYFRRTDIQNIIVLLERVAAVLLIYMLVSNTSSLATIAIALLSVRFFSIYVQIGIWSRYLSREKIEFRILIPKSGTNGINLTVMLSLLANSALTHGNQLVLAYSSPTELPGYSLAFQVVGLVFLFQSQVVRYLNRDISEYCALQDRKISLYVRNAFYVSIGSAVLALALYVLHPLLYVFLGESKFPKIGEYLVVLGVWLVVAGVGQVVTQYLLELKQETYYFFVTVLGGIAAIFLGFLFVPAYGGLGVAMVLLGVHGIAITANFIRVLMLLLEKGATHV